MEAVSSYATIAFSINGQRRKVLLQVNQKMFNQEPTIRNEVRVIHCGNDGIFPLAGKTVGDVRRGFRDAFNLSSELCAWVNGVETDDATVLRNGDVLKFNRKVGKKGGIPDYMSESEIRQLYGDDGYKQIRKAGLKPIAQPVFSGHDVTSFGRSLKNRDADFKKAIPITVDVDRETLTYKGRTFKCERTLALILKCLIDAGGEIRSTTDIRNAFPGEPFEERLDQTIKRKLIPHESEVGKLVESVSKRGYRLRI